MIKTDEIKFDTHSLKILKMQDTDHYVGIKLTKNK